MKFIPRAAAVSAVAATASHAAPARFEPLTPGVAVGSAELVKDGKAAANALVAAVRLDMAPDNMAGMTVPVGKLDPRAAAVHRMVALLPMAGRYGWTVKIAVPGDAPLTQILNIAAKP